MEIANNNHLRDFILSNGAVMQDFSGMDLEYTYFLRNKKEVEHFLENRQQYFKDIQGVKKNLNFDKVSCKFTFGKYQPSEQIQKQIIDFQSKVCDEIIVQMVGRDLETLRKIYDYAYSKYDKPLVTLVDIGLHPTILMATFGFIEEVKPNSTKWDYRKIDTFINRYWLVSEYMQGLGIPYILTGCNKRCGIENFRDVCVSVIAQGFFGFQKTCTKYWYSSGKGFSPNMDKFNPETWEWERHKNEDYRNSRLRDLIELHKTKFSESEIQKREKVKQLFENLKKTKR